MRSWNRMPAAITRSASSVQLLAATEPCIPTMPSANSWSPGKPPRPTSVLVTGI